MSIDDIHPYTDEQAIQFHAAMFESPTAPTVVHAHEYLRRLHAAGITVTFPDPPRYAAVSDEPLSWDVVDTQQDVAVAYLFCGGNPDAQRHARDLADRLNREVGP